MSQTENTSNADFNARTVQFELRTLFQERGMLGMDLMASALSNDEAKNEAARIAIDENRRAFELALVKVAAL